MGIEKSDKGQAALNQYAAIKHASDDKISIDRVYYKITGYNHPAAAVLSELMFWTLPQSKTGKTGLRIKRDGHLWLAVARDEWMERKCLLPRVADGGINHLLKMGIVEKENFYFNGKPRVHLRIIPDVFFKCYSRVMAVEYKDIESPDEPQTEINDLYEMMGMRNLPFGNLPNGESNLPNGELENLPNGEFINSLNSLNTTITENDDPFQEPEQKRPRDILDGIIELGNMPGAKAAIRRDGLAARIEKMLHGKKPTSRDGIKFVEFVDKQEQKGQKWEVFARWMVKQNGYDPQFWGWARMQDNWGCAFTKVESINKREMAMVE